MRTLQSGPLRLEWRDEEFKGEWFNAQLRVCQYDGDTTWTWVILDEDFDTRVSSDGFDRAQTACDDMARFLRSVGAIRDDSETGKAPVAGIEASP